MRAIKNVRRQPLRFMDRDFYVMIGQRSSQVWEIVTSDRKMSAQLVKIQSPEREIVLQQLR